MPEDDTLFSYDEGVKNKKLLNNFYSVVLSEELLGLPHTHEEKEKKCASAILEVIADRDIQSFPQLSYQTMHTPSELRVGLHILKDDAGLIEVKKYPKIQQEFYTLSEKGIKLKNSIGNLSGTKSGVI